EANNMELVDKSLVENAICRRITLDDFHDWYAFVNNIKNMFELCRDKEGVGLAAPQVGWMVKLFISFDLKRWNLYINPEYIGEGETYEIVENCLTYEDAYKVKRYKKILARWQSIDLKEDMLIDQSQIMEDVV